MTLTENQLAAGVRYFTILANIQKRLILEGKMKPGGPVPLPKIVKRRRKMQKP